MEVKKQKEIDLKVLDKRLLDADGQPHQEYFPRYMTQGSAGVDLRACIDEDIYLKPGRAVTVPVGFAVDMQNPRMAALIIPRSGLGTKHGIVVGNLVGLIDSDYQGQLMVNVWNRGEAPYVIKPMERIAQLAFVPVIQASFNVVENFGEVTGRGEGGFNSTGTH